MSKEEQKHLYPEDLASYLIDVPLSILVNLQDHNLLLYSKEFCKQWGALVCIRNREERLEEDIIAFFFSQTKEWELEEMVAATEFLLSAASSIQIPQL